MSPRTLATFATVLSAARDADAALALLQQEAWDVERSAQLALFLCDARRQMITERLTVHSSGVGRTPLTVSVEHLPSAIKRALNAGGTVADFGGESDDYLKLLGVTAQQGGGILSVRGLMLDGELAGFIAVYEPKRRFGNRVIERLGPSIDLFSLAFERIVEHEARFEAVQTLEALTRDIHAEYNRTVRSLKSELDEARRQNGSPGGPETARIAQLERALADAGADLKARVNQLAAVEEQVSRATSKLEEAHVELHAQTERARALANSLYEIERLVSGDHAGKTADEIAERIRELLPVRNDQA